MSIEVRRKFNGGNGGATVVASDVIATGYGAGGTEEGDYIQVNQFLEPNECIKLALDLLEGNIKPGALSVIKDLIRENSYTPRVIVKVSK